MRLASDYRKLGRGALSGKWAVAVLAALVALVLSNALSVTYQYGANVDQIRVESELWNWTSEATEAWLARAQAVYGFVAGWNLVVLFIGGAVTVGYAKYNACLAAHENPTFSTIFDGFKIYGKSRGRAVVPPILVALWSLLFVIPGIVAGYRYAMAPYLLAEHPEMGVMEAIAESKRIMLGRKGRMFCMQFSFIGWSLLTSLPAVVGFACNAPFATALGIAMSCAATLFVKAYASATDGAFYLEATGQEERLTAK